MDGQNFQNEQNTNVESTQQNYYQDNTTTQVPPVVETAPEKKTDTLAIVSLVMGILSIVLSCCNTYVGIILAIVGIVLSVISQKNNGKSGMAIAGLVCSIIAIVLSVILIILAAVGLAILSEAGIDYSSLY